MSEKYLSISEFADKVKVSPQSIYQRMKREDDDIHRYIKIQKGKKVISENAVEIYNKDLKDYEEVAEEKTRVICEEIAEIYKKQVEYLTAEIEVKNKQIEELQEQLKASSERETNYQTLLNQQQKLNGIDKQRVLQLEQETQTAKKKKGIFGIFRKKQEEEENNGGDVFETL